MPETLTVEVYPDADAIGNNEPTVFNDVDFVSFVNEGTFGPPALVAPGKPSRPDGRPTPPTARPGKDVLYINTSLVPLFKITRDGDE